MTSKNQSLRSMGWSCRDFHTLLDFYRLPFVDAVNWLSSTTCSGQFNIRYIEQRGCGHAYFPLLPVCLQCDTAKSLRAPVHKQYTATKKQVANQEFNRSIESTRLILLPLRSPNPISINKRILNYQSINFLTVLQVFHV